MTTIDREQQAAAKVVGIVYLVAMATSMFAELYFRRPLIVASDAAATAANILANETVFRMAGVIHLLTVATDAIMAVASYVVLRRVHKHLAILAAAWRVADAAILAVSVVFDSIALRFLASADSLTAVDEKQRQALARLFIGAGASGFQVGFVFLGLGSALFAWLWFRSGYVPRVIAAWGIFASMMLSAGTAVIMVFPRLGVIGLSYMAPMFFYEVGLGLWLVLKGLREPRTS